MSGDDIVRTLRMSELPEKVGYKTSTIYGLIAQGKFPKPFKLTPGGRAAGWLESTIDNWICEQAYSDTGKPK